MKMLFPRVCQACRQGGIDPARTALTFHTTTAGTLPLCATCFWEILEPQHLDREIGPVEAKEARRLDARTAVDLGSYYG